MNIDWRKEWFKERLLVYFNESDKKLVDNLLMRNNGIIDNQMGLFFNNHADDIKNRIFFVYKTYYETIIDEEIEVQEEVSKSRLGSLNPSLEDSKTHKEKKVKKKKGRKGKHVKAIDELDEDDQTTKHQTDFNNEVNSPKIIKKKSKKKTSKNVGETTDGRLSPYTIMENFSQEDQLESQQPLLITVRKTIQKIVQVPQLQGFFGPINENNYDESQHYVYFIKKSTSSLPNFKTAEEAFSQMPHLICVGSLSGSIISSMETILTMIFQPLIQMDSSAEDETFNSERPSSFYRLLWLKKNYESYSEEMLKSCDSTFGPLSKEILKASGYLIPDCKFLNVTLSAKLEELLKQIKIAQNKITQQHVFKIPDWLKSKIQNFDEVSELNEIKSELTDILKEWTKTVFDLKSLIPSYDTKETNLLYEYDYWNKIMSDLQSVVDNYNLKEITDILKICKNLDCEGIDNFEKICSSTFQFYSACEENVYILNMITGYFNVLIFGEFDKIAGKIPNLLEAVKKIWVLSKYFKKAENLSLMLMRIKYTMCQRIRKHFNVSVIFRGSLDELIGNLCNATNMLLIWKSAYMEIKHKIESQKRTFIAKWEFDEDILFVETDYIIKVIQDILRIIQIIQDFRNLLNSNVRLILKSDEISVLEDRLDHLPVKIEKVDFDIYNPIFYDEWQEVLNFFDIDVYHLDTEMKNKIIKSFQDLRCLETGITAFIDMKKLKKNRVICNLFPHTGTEFLVPLFSNKIHNLECDFNMHMSNYEKFYITDTISFCRTLFNKLNSFVEIFDNLPEIASDENYQQNLKKISEFKLKVSRFESMVYNGWCDNFTIIINRIKKKNIIRLSSFSNSSAELTGQQDFVKIIKDGFNSELLQKTTNTSLTDKGLTFEINFEEEFFHKMEEAINLNKMGFKFPRNIHKFLTGKEEFLSIYNSVNDIINRYNCLINSLSSAQILLLKNQILDVETYIRPGLDRYTWSSLNIQNFTKTVIGKLEEFSSLLCHVNETFHGLDKQIEVIENAKLCFDPKLFPKEDIHNLNCQDFFAVIIKHQKIVIDEVIEAYDNISRTLMQLEFFIFKTNTGNSNRMIQYYGQYSDKILRSLIRAILVSLSEFKELIDGKLDINFRMKINLESIGPYLHPSVENFYNLVKSTIYQIFERFMALRTWKNESCVIIDDDSKEVEGFYNSLIYNDDIINSVKSILHILTNLCENMTKSVSRWLRYDNIWKHNKFETLEKFLKTNPRLIDYESKFDFYSNVINELEEIPELIYIGAARICVKFIKQQLKDHCLEWKNRLGEKLMLSTRCDVSNLQKNFQKLHAELNTRIINEDSLIKVLTTIENIKNEQFDMELKFNQLNEKYYELFLQNIDVLVDDKKNFESMKLFWESLSDGALYRECALEFCKVSLFSKMEIFQQEFIKQSNELLEKYHRDEQLSKFEIGFDFDICVHSLKNFMKEFEIMNSKKEHIEKIQRLFNLRCIDFTAYENATMELKKFQIQLGL